MPKGGKVGMEREKKQALEAAGFQIGNAEDFLELSEEERKMVDLRITISRRIRTLREKLKLSQQQLAAQLHSSQSRIAKMEAAANDVSLDLLFKGLFAVGGRLGDLTKAPSSPQRQATMSRS